MPFTNIIEKAQILKTQADRTIDLSLETGEIHFNLWDNRDLASIDAIFFPIPFYKTFESLATGLEDLTILMGHADAKKSETLRPLFTYTTALSRPHRRISLYDEKLVTIGFADTKDGHATYLDSSKMLADPITSYNKIAQDLVMAYSNGDTLFGGSVAKDQFLMHMMHKLVQSRTFSKEGLEAASDEMVKALGRSLDNLQELYEVDPETMVREYAEILDSIQETVVDMDNTYKILQPGNKRHIFGLSDAAKGMFKVTKGIADHMGAHERQAYLIRQEVVTRGNGELSLLEKMACGDVTWSTLLPDVIDMIKIKHAEPIDKHPILEYGNNGLVEAKYAKVEIEDIIGQEENVKRLGQLLYAFGEGRKIPNIVMYGRPGRGKTMSLRALADCHPELRTILLSYQDINNLSGLVEETRKYPYQVVAYVDDMHFPMGFDIEKFKTTTCGVKDDLPTNFALVVSVNPEAWDHLAESVKNRFGKVLDYNKQLDETHWKEVFNVAARHEGLDYKNELWDGFFKDMKEEPNEKYFSDHLNGRMVRDYMREQKALQDIDFPSHLR